MKLRFYSFFLPCVVFCQDTHFCCIPKQLNFTCCVNHFYLEMHSYYNSVVLQIVELLNTLMFGHIKGLMHLLLKVFVYLQRILEQAQPFRD